VSRSLSNSSTGPPSATDAELSSITSTVVPAASRKAGWAVFDDRSPSTVPPQPGAKVIADPRVSCTVARRIIGVLPCVTPIPSVPVWTEERRERSDWSDEGRPVVEAP